MLEMGQERVDGNLYERELHMAAIDKLLQGAAQGHGGTLVLSGPAGSGKTSLLSLAHHLAGPRFERRRVAGSPMERHLAWALARDLLQPDRLVRPGPELSADLYGMTRTWLGRRAGDPLLLCIDDLQFADPHSLGVLCYAARRLDRCSVAMIVTVRPWPPDALEAMETVANWGDVRMLDLPPLGIDSSRSLVRSFLSTQDLDQVEELVLGSQGNPLVLVEAAKAAADMIRPEVAAIDAYASTPRALLVSQLAGLPAKAVTCARAVSVLGGRASRDLLAAVSALSRDQFVETYDALVAAGILHDEGGEQTTVTYAVVARALAGAVAPATRQRIFQRAFEHFYDRGEFEQAAGCIEPGNLHHDPRALEALESAGSRSLRLGALGEALQHFAQAISMSEPTPSTALLMLHADALYAAGHSSEAAAGYTRLLARKLSPEIRFEVLSRCVRATTYAGTLHEALNLYETLLSTANPRAPGSADVWLEHAHVVWEIAGPRKALQAVEAIPAESGAQHQMVGLVRAFFALENGDPSSIGVLEAAGLATRRLAATHPDSALGSFNTLSLWVTSLAATERYDDALDVVDFGVGWLDAAGAIRATVPLRIARLGILALSGRMSEVAGEVDRMRETLVLDALSEPHVAIFEADAFANLGETSLAEALLAKVPTMPAHRTWFAAMSLLMVRARCLLDRGDVAGAVDVARHLEDLANEYGVGTPSTPAWAAIAVETYLAGRLYAEALRIATWLESRSPVLAPRWSSMVSLSARAEHAASVAHDRPLAKELYLQAMRASDLQPLDRARIGLRFGQFLRQTGEPALARPVLAGVLAAAEGCGASLLSTSARAELAAAGGRRRRVNRPTGLTPQERRVAAHALTGASTRQIASALHLSPRTVESHLGSIYRKAGVKSRRELLVRGHISDL